MNYRDTVEGVIEFCESEGWSCESIKRLRDALVEIRDLEYSPAEAAMPGSIIACIRDIAAEALEESS